MLRHEDDGVDRVIRAIAYPIAKHPRRKKLKRELRSRVQSDRFDRGWKLLRATYAGDVEAPDNMVPPNARATAGGVRA